MRSTPSEPVRLDILVLDDSTMLTVASVIDPLRAVNRLAKDQLFAWQVLSANGQPVRLVGGFEMMSDGAFASGRGGDILVVIASFNQQQHADTRLISELRRQKDRYSIIAGVEAGTWLLARAGIAAGKRVTTHWEDLEALATRWPEIDVLPDRYVTDANLWTCGGASPALDMMLELIEHKVDKAMALEVASVFIYDQIHASSDRQPTLSLGKLEHIEPRIAASVRIMERNLDSPLPVSAIARRAGLSAKMLEILFVRHLGMTPGRYYQRLRLLAARKLLLDSALTVQEVAIRTGYNSQSAFSRSFRKNFGESPSRLRATHH